MVRKACALIGLVIIGTVMAVGAYIVDTISGFRTKGTSDDSR